MCTLFQGQKLKACGINFSICSSSSRIQLTGPAIATTLLGRRLLRGTGRLVCSGMAVRRLIVADMVAVYVCKVVIGLILVLGTP